MRGGSGLPRGPHSAEVVRSRGILASLGRLAGSHLIASRLPTSPLGSNLRFSSVRSIKTAAASQRSLIGAPGFEPGTSATRTQRSTGLSHAPELSGNYYGRGGMDLASLGRLAGSPLDRFAPTFVAARLEPTERVSAKRAGGRTHRSFGQGVHHSRKFCLTDGGGFEPTRTMSTRFPIVRLKPLGHPSHSASAV